MNPTKIPVSISPCNLVDAFVEIEFQSDLNSEAIIRRIEGSQNKAYDRIPRLDQYGHPTDKYFLSDGQFRFFVVDGKLGINIINEYPGWNAYHSKIESIVHPICDSVFFSKARLKYVSRWADLSILDNIDGEVKFYQFYQLFPGTEISFSAKWNSTNPAFDPVAQVRLREMVTDQFGMASYVDVDLSTDLPEIQGRPENTRLNGSRVMLALNELHKAEKNMFFSLLSEKFVNTLSPVWPS